MNGPASVDELLELYEVRGGQSYGESITQTEHALQCAAHARDAGATPTLIVAALFHDVGTSATRDESKLRELAACDATEQQV